MRDRDAMAERKWPQTKSENTNRRKASYEHQGRQRGYLTPTRLGYYYCSVVCPILLQPSEERCRIWPPARSTTILWSLTESLERTAKADKQPQFHHAQGHLGRKISIIGNLFCVWPVAHGLMGGGRCKPKKQAPGAMSLQRSLVGAH